MSSLYFLEEVLLANPCWQHPRLVGFGSASKWCFSPTNSPSGLTVSPHGPKDSVRTESETHITCPPAGAWRQNTRPPHLGTLFLTFLILWSFLFILRRKNIRVLKQHPRKLPVELSATLGHTWRSPSLAKRPSHLSSLCHIFNHPDLGSGVTPTPHLRSKPTFERIRFWFCTFLLHQLLTPLLDFLIPVYNVFLETLGDAPNEMRGEGAHGYFFNCTRGSSSRVTAKPTVGGDNLISAALRTGRQPWEQLHGQNSCELQWVELSLSFCLRDLHTAILEKEVLT